MFEIALSSNEFAIHSNSVFTALSFAMGAYSSHVRSLLIHICIILYTAWYILCTAWSKCTIITTVILCIGCECSS